MTENTATAPPERRSTTRRGPIRRVRRWARHTPNGEIALTMLVAGAILAIAAIILALIVF